MSIIRLEARYIGREIEAASFAYDSASFQEAEYNTKVGADGSVMRSEIRPAYLLVRGLPAEFDPQSDWTHVECEAAFIGWSSTHIVQEQDGVTRFVLR